MSNKESISRDAIFQSQTREAADFYKLIVTVSSSFLGGSLVFLDKIAPEPVKYSVYILAVGWFLLIASIVLIGFIRSKNLESAHHVLENEISEARVIDSKKRTATKITLLLLSCGILFIMIFGLINIG